MAASELTKTPAAKRRKTARRAKVAPEEQCVAGDENKAHARGLCSPCYREALARVKAKEVTWAELEAAGLAKPSHGRVGRTAFAQKLARLKKNGKR